MHRFGVRARPPGGWSVLLAACCAVAASTLLLGAPVGAQAEANTTVIVRKAVVGPATSGATVVVHCEFMDDGELIVNETTLNFDANGTPTTASGEDSSDYANVDGAWQAVFGQIFERNTCTFTEAETGGAVSTSWTCDYEFESSAEPEGLGCAAASGEGVGPATVVVGEQNDEIVSQTTTVAFTNTYEGEPPPPPPPPPPPVKAAPAFTG